MRYFLNHFLTIESGRLIWLNHSFHFHFFLLNLSIIDLNLIFPFLKILFLLTTDAFFQFIVEFVIYLLRDLSVLAHFFITDLDTINNKLNLLFSCISIISILFNNSLFSFFNLVDISYSYYNYFFNYYY